MSLKSFSFGSLTVLATLILAIVPISFSTLCFLEPISAQTTPDRKAEADRLLAQGLQLYQTSRYREAIPVLESALQIYRDIKDKNGEAVSLVNLGAVYDSLGQYQKAIDFYQQSLEIRTQIGDLNGEAVSLGNLGSTYNNLGQYQKAIDFQQQSLAIRTQIGDRNGEATSLNNLGFAFNKLNQQEISILFYKQAVNTFEAIRKDIKGLKKEEQQSLITRIAGSYRELADLLLQQNRIMEAVQVLDLLKVQELEDYLKNIKGSDRSAQGIRLLAPELAISDKLLAISY